MTKNSSSSISKQQKILLKVLNCLWVQYVSNRTNGVKVFMANPSEETYEIAKDELNAIAFLIHSNPGLKSLDIPLKKKTIGKLIASLPDSTVAIDTSKNPPFNTFLEFENRAFESTADKEGVRKTIEILNNNENINQAYQFRPQITKFLDANNNLTNIWVTQVAISERTGCAGIANTGFVTFAIEVDIEAYPFNICLNPSIQCGQ
jgi:hypothetical protein